MRDASDVFGPSSRRVALIASGLTTSLLRLGEIKAALETSNRSIAILERHSQPESYTIAQSLSIRGLIWLSDQENGLWALDVDLGG